MALRKDEYLEDGEWKKQYGLLLQERSEKQSNVIISELYNIRKIKDSILREKEYDKFYNNPENLAPQRLFIGRTCSENVGLFLMDSTSIFTKVSNQIPQLLRNAGQTIRTVFQILKDLHRQTESHDADKYEDNTEMCTAPVLCQNSQNKLDTDK